ncbi:MAG TPA: DUF4384 domain-containing protein [Pyrinomonadaceae bacterium]|nr:DUF4384 domain-containing protein [Pyrinomonadaceae bacterium]
MKAQVTIGALVLLLAGLAVLQAPAQQEEENVRGAFLTSRPKEKPAQSSNAKPVRRRPRPASTTASTGPSTPSSSNSAGPASTATPAPSNSGAAKMATQKMGLGVTLFTRDANGLAVRVDPSHEFRNGESVRILLETNADGYLYIFNTTNNGPPVMIYPAAEIDDAGNYIQSHVPFEIPSSTAAEERLRWFRFDDVAGTERLLFAFTREPLTGVPIEDDLITYCREMKRSCSWKPSPEIWVQLQKEMNAPLKTDKSKKYGKAQTPSEQAASTRGIGLSRQDPEPSLIMMAVSTGSKSLVTSLDLIHK